MDFRRRTASLLARLPHASSSLVVALFGLLLTGFAWLYVVRGLSAERAAEIERVHRDNGAMARAFEEHVRRVFKAADGMLLYLKHEFEEQGRVSAEMLEFVDRAKGDPILNQIAVVDAAGDVVMSAVPHAEKVNLSQHEVFRAHTESAAAGLVIGKPVRTRGSGTWSFFLTRRLDRADGTFAGIVSLGLDPAYFSGYYEQLELGPDRAVMLVGRDGIVRARRFQKDAEVGQDLGGAAMFARIDAEPAGHHELVGVIDRQRRFGSYRALPDFPLVVAVSELASSALAPFERRRSERLGALVAFTLFVGAFCAALIAAGRREHRQSELLSAELAERRRAERALRESAEAAVGAEERIRQSERFIRNILDTVDEGFIVVDRDYRIRTVNQAYCGQASLTCDEAIGRRCYEVSHQSSRPCFEEGEECAVKKVFETGKPHTVVHKHPGPEGHLLFVETKGFPIKDDAGNTVAVIETLNNITERHLLEEERLKTQKLESIGTLAGGIAHDFNNLLQGVFGYISMAKLCLDQKERSLAMIEQAEKALHQSVSLTTQLLTFSKGGRPVREPVAPEPVIESAVKFALSGSRNDYRLAFAPGLWPVYADAGQLGQVIQNIVMNAGQAMPRGGCVEIAARNVRPADPELPHGLARRNHVMISIRDSGTGIAPQDLERIFDPYFTTKERGSGLGLATSYSIVRNHEGRIVVQSEPGQGSTFALFLPAAEAAAERPARAPAAPGLVGARVLVMDDEALVRNIAGELLRSFGHEVELAERGEEAIALYEAARAKGRAFDLVILDLTIRGGMGGVETVGRLREIDPGVKAVASSGYSDDAAQGGHRELGFAAFLKKPYDIDRLQNTLHDLLT